MEAAVEEQGRPTADLEIESEHGAVNISHDDDFDFDIGGPDDNLDVAAGAESITEGLTSQDDGKDAPDSTYTYDILHEGTQQPAEDSYDQETHDQGYVQEAFDIDAAAETEEFAKDKQNSYLEGDDGDEDAPQGEKDQFEEIEEEIEVHGDEIPYDEAAGEFDVFDDAAPEDAEQTHDTMDTATSVEYAHQEEENLEAHADADEDLTTRVVGDRELLPEDSVSDGAVDDEEPMTEASNGKERVENIEAHIDVEDNMPVIQQQAETIVESPTAPGWAEGEGEDQQRSDEQPNVRVLWRTEEFRLFAESPVDDPDTYFFKSLEFLQQPLSQFLSSLRQVIANELAPFEEVFVKVDGLGLEFGETTTNDFLEKTTFGQISDLHNRLVKLDDDPESHELYLYLDARPSCLLRFNELKKGAGEGKGLSHFALYYEDTSTDTPADDDDEDDQNEGPRDIYSDDVSVNESYDELQGDMDENRQDEQSYNPFRITEAQQHAIRPAPSSGLVEEDGDKIAPSVDIAGVHGTDDETGSPDHASGKDHAGLDLEVADMLDDAPIDEILQSTMSGLEEVAEVAAEEVAEDYGNQDDDEQHNGADDELVGVETSVDMLEDLGEKHDPTDDHDTAENDDYLDLDNDDVDTADDKPVEHVEQPGTPGPTSHGSSATATLDGDDHGNGDNASLVEHPADFNHAVETSTPPDVDPPENELDEIDWKEGEDDEDEVADQNPTDLSTSSISAKRSRQEDEDDDGLGDESTVKRRRT